MRSVIFDLDGTLADTSGDLIAAANAAFVALGHGVQLDPVRDAGTALRGGRAMLRLGLARLTGHAVASAPDAAFMDWAHVRLDAGAEGQVDRGYPVLLEAYGAALSHHTTFYPGALDAVAALRRNGFAVGICTNKPEALAEQLLCDLGVRDAFGSLIGADTLPVRKPDPAPLRAAAIRAGGDPARCLLVGDSVTDRDTSTAAGVPSVLVTFSPAGRSVADLMPEALLDDYGDLPAIAARLLPVAD